MLSSTVRGVIIRSVNQNQIHLYSKRVRTDIPKKIIKSKTPKKLQKSSVVRSRKFTKNKLDNGLSIPSAISNLIMYISLLIAQKK